MQNVSQPDSGGARRANYEVPERVGTDRCRRPCRLVSAYCVNLDEISSPFCFCRMSRSRAAAVLRERITKYLSERALTAAGVPACLSEEFPKSRINQAVARLITLRPLDYVLINYLLLDLAREKMNSRPPVLAVRTLIQPP